MIAFFPKNPGLKITVLFLDRGKKNWFGNAFLYNLVLVFLKMWIVMVYDKTLTRKKENRF